MRVLSPLLMVSTTIAIALDLTSDPLWSGSEPLVGYDDILNDPNTIDMASSFIGQESTNNDNNILSDNSADSDLFRTPTEVDISGLKTSPAMVDSNSPVLGASCVDNPSRQSLDKLRARNDQSCSTSDPLPLRGQMPGSDEPEQEGSGIWGDAEGQDKLSSQRNNFLKDPAQCLPGYVYYLECNYKKNTPRYLFNGNMVTFYYHECQPSRLFPFCLPYEEFFSLL